MAATLSRKGVAKKSWWQRALRALALLVVVLLAALAVVWVGLRDEILGKLLGTLDERLSEAGIYLSIERHHLTWNGGAMLEGVELFSDEAKGERVARLENLQVRLPLMDYFRGDAKIIVTAEESGLGVETAAGELHLEDLEFDFEIGTGSLLIDRFESGFQGLRVTLEGGLAWEPGSDDEKQKITIPDLSGLVKAGSWLEFPEGHPTLALKVIPKVAPEEGHNFEAVLSGEDFRWKTLPLDRAWLRVGLAEGVVQLSEISLHGFGGQLNGDMAFDYQNERIVLREVRSSMDPFRLVEALPLAESLSSSMKAFQVDGEIHVSGEDLVLDLEDFSRSRGVVKVAMDDFQGETLLLEKVRLQAELAEGAVVFSAVSLHGFGGQVNGEITYDYGKEQVVIREVESSMDPFRLIEVLSPNESLSSSMKAFQVDGEFSASGENVVIDLEDFSRSRGAFKVAADGFQRETLALEKVRFQAELAEGAVVISEMLLHGFGGQLSGGMEYDYGKKRIVLREVESSMDVFRLVGSLPLAESVGSMAKRFRVLGGITVRGDNVVFDLEDFSGSRGVFKVVTDDGIGITLSSKEIVLTKLLANVEISKGMLTVDMSRFSAFGGSGSGRISHPTSGNFHYQAKIDGRGFSAAQIGKAFGDGDEYLGTIRLSYAGRGASKPRSHSGKGRVDISGGNYYSIPVFGGLRSFLQSSSKVFGDDVAGNLGMDFELENGVIRSTNLKIESDATRISVAGEVDHVAETVNLNLQAGLTGIVGTITSVVGKILTVHGEGSIGSINWSFAPFAVFDGTPLRDFGDGTASVVVGVGDIVGKGVETTVDKTGKFVDDVGEGIKKGAQGAFDGIFGKKKEEEKE
ncbi:AsmA-like C-terminal region-containing protein [Haloferula sp.]|uniref:AsmA-like C-terminal region-containing protein n=1 Tax=Haloferula sp. TaxID=2497595 RepID=UPI00329C662E